MRPEFLMAFIVVMSGLGVVTKIALTLLNRRPARLDDATARTLEAMRQQLARLEQSVDTVAIEVERISEGQRFTTKLLGDRAASNPPKVVTPH